IRGIVVYDKNRESTQLRRLRCRPFGIFISKLKAHREMKGTALAFGAVEPHPALHHVYEINRDGESKPRSAKTSRHGTVRLAERLEYHLLPVGRDAWTGILHGEMKLNFPCACIETLDRLDSNSDFSRIREFDGIANKVDHNLAKSMRIAD